jgi:hypothetical protein
LSFAKRNDKEYLFQPQSLRLKEILLSITASGRALSRPFADEAARFSKYFFQANGLGAAWQITSTQTRFS